MVIDMLQRPLEQPDLAPLPSFSETKQEVLDCMRERDEHEVLDDIIGDIAERLPEILSEWVSTRESGDQLAFGDYLDDMIERTLHENCYLYSA